MADLTAGVVPKAADASRIEDGFTVVTTVGDPGGDTVFATEQGIREAFDALAIVAATELTISTGAITVTQSFHKVDTEADAASDDLVTINGGVEGFIIYIRAEHADRTVVLKDGTGNLELAGSDITLTNIDRAVPLLYDTVLTKWLLMDVADAGSGGGDLKADGTVPLTANWGAGYKIVCSQFESNIAGGTAPLVITSPTVVPNLNVDQVDGKDSTDLLLVDGSQAMTGDLNMGNQDITTLLRLQFKAATELTINAGVVTATQGVHTIDTAGDGATDDVDTINGPANQQLLLIRAEHTDRTVVLKHGTGNLELGGGDFTLDATDQFALLYYDATLTKWVLIGATPGAGGGDLKADGSVPLTANWDVGAYTLQGTQFISDIAGGTAPLVITSGTVVPNLNVDQVDGLDSTDLLLVDGSQGVSGDWDAGSHKITAEQLESDIATGTAPLVVASTTVVANLDADTVDGKEATDLDMIVWNWRVIEQATAVTTGDGKDRQTVPTQMNGYNLTRAHAHVDTASSSGLPTVQLHNETAAADILSTRITIDENEVDSTTALNAPVIDGGEDDMTTADILRVDVDVAGTGTKGLTLRLEFTRP